MAARYLRATGNWNGAVWAATSGGTAGSAATPTSVDDVYIEANFTVTLSSDAQAGGIIHTNGTLSLGSYTLTLTDNTSSYGAGFVSGGTTARTIDLGSGRLVVTIGNSAFSNFTLSGSNLTFNAGTSIVEINHVAYQRGFDTLSKSFNDVRINLGTGSNSVEMNIYGSATFNLLEIRSANSAAHTVNFHADLYVYKFISIGSSTTNRILLDTISGTEGLLLAETENATLYAQNSNFSIAYIYSALTFAATVQPVYVGSNSISVADGNILESDPPKISTLIDPLTVAPGSNSNWSAATYSGATLPTGVTTGVEGGGYSFTSPQGIVSTNTFDFYDSDLIFEIPDNSTPNVFIEVGIKSALSAERQIYLSSQGAAAGFQLFSNGQIRAFTKSYSRNNGGQSDANITNNNIKYLKMRLAKSGADYTTARYSYSLDGKTWVLINEHYSLIYNYLLSSRLYIITQNTSTGSRVIGSINTLPKSLNTGAFLQLF